MCTHKNGNKYCKHVLSSLLNIIIMSLLIASTFKFYDNMNCNQINNTQITTQNDNQFLEFSPKTSFIFMLIIEILMIITLLFQFVLFAIEYYDENKKMDYIYID